MSLYDTFLQYIPQVAKPTQKKLPFGQKFKWTLIVLVLYFLLKKISLFGLGAAGLAQFEQLSVLLGAEFGSIISLGIGPIVTASIILQLLNGSGILKFNTHTAEGKARFQGTNKMLAVIFIVFEAILYVVMGGLPPPAELAGTAAFFTLELLLIVQLILGGLLIMLLDDLVQKWGFGSGISLFIAAGVAESLFIQTFSWFTIPGTDQIAGAIPRMLVAFGQGPEGLPIIAIAIAAIIATLVVFGLAVFFQSMKVEIPLSFGRVRGYGMRWPLNFLYTSNIPVILVAALLANMTVGSQLLQNKFGTEGVAGFFVTLASWFSAPNLIPDIIQQGTFMIGWAEYAQALFYMVVLIIGSMVFSYFWMQSSGMDAQSQAKQIMASGLQIPGFRKDPRIMEHVLGRYITPLTIMGGATIGFLAAFADITGALTSGTGLLLAILIVYKLYEDIAKQHMMDMNPMMRKFMGGR